MPRQRLPQLLAFALLILQVSIPWSAKYFVTMDGPAHLYASHVVKQVVLGRAPYSTWYTLHFAKLTNWGTALVFNAASMLFTPANAEKGVFSFSMILAFFCFAYLTRSLDLPHDSYTPMLNFLATTWFLWIGFYNFYLATALFALVLGYSIRHSGDLTWRRAAIASAGLLAVFATHVLPAAAGALAIAIVALWRRPPLRQLLQEAPRWLLVLTPTLALLAAFAIRSGEHPQFLPQIGWAWAMFPLHLFAASEGRLGEQLILYPAMMFLMAVGIAGMDRREWRSSRGALAVTSVLLFAVYLLVPDRGFGGSEVKIRFAWLVLLPAGLVAVTTRRIRLVMLPVSLFIAVCLSAHLVQAALLNVNAVSHAVEQYAAATDSIPPGSIVVRLRYPTRKIAQDFGFEGIALEPLFHVDSWIATQRNLVALSDYQAPSRIFPVIYRRTVTEDQLWQLWDLEGTSQEGSKSLRVLLKGSIPIDYLVVLGDNTTAEYHDNFDALAKDLAAEMQPVATDPRGAFVHVYKRRSPLVPWGQREH